MGVTVAMTTRISAKTRSNNVFCTWFIASCVFWSWFHFLTNLQCTYVFMAWKKKGFSSFLLIWIYMYWGVVKVNFESTWTRGNTTQVWASHRSFVSFFTCSLISIVNWWWLMRSIVYWPSPSSEHSSESETCKAMFSSSQLWQSCSLQVVVHFKPLARHWQFGSLQTEVHLQDKNSMMTSGAGAPVIQQMVSLSFSTLHPWPLGSGILGHCSRARCHTPAW